MTFDEVNELLLSWRATGFTFGPELDCCKFRSSVLWRIGTDIAAYVQFGENDTEFMNRTELLFFDINLFPVGLCLKRIDLYKVAHGESK